MPKAEKKFQEKEVATVVLLQVLIDYVLMRKP